MTNTETNTPERVPDSLFVVIGENGAIWATFDTREKAERYPGPRMFEAAPRSIAEYRRVTTCGAKRFGNGGPACYQPEGHRPPHIFECDSSED